MLQQGVLVWAGATGAAIVVAGATALYWTEPYLFWPNSSRAEMEKSAPEFPAALPSQPAPIVAKAEPETGAVATPNVEKPAFDVVNVEPTGEAVVAGRAAPNAKVELRDAGKTIAEATADNSGQFVMIPPVLAPGDHSLTLTTGAGGSEPETSPAIAVAVPAPAAATALAPAARAEKPAEAAPTPASDRLAIRSVEASAEGRLAARGGAEPNAVVRLYLNGAYVADAKTKADGRWSLTILRGMAPGAYLLRADEINPTDAKVVARAEAPFNIPAAPERAAANAASASAAPATEQSSADVVVDAVNTAHVAPGDTLWGMSQTYYGDGTRYRLIFAANAQQIRNPNLIYPGQIFVVPKPEPKL